MMNSDNSDNSNPNRASDENIHHLSNQNLLRKIEEEGKLLIQKEIELAKTELQAEFRSESQFAGGFAVGIAAGSAAGILLLVTAIFALSLVMPGWVAGLILSGAMLLVSGIGFLYGWSSRVKRPLARTRDALNADKKLFRGHSGSHAA